MVTTTPPAVRDARGSGASVVWTAIETVLATGLALYLSIRLESPLPWVMLPLALLLASGQSLSEYGLDLRFRPPSLSAHVALGVTLLVLYGALHASVATLLLSREFSSPEISPRLALDVLTEFLSVAFPEELYFRGYLQTRWNRVFGRPWHLFAARLGPGLLIQATIFAACHAVIGDWTGLRVFFFALLAGWLRERNDSILAPSVYHAVANVWYGILSRGFH